MTFHFNYHPCWCLGDSQSVRSSGEMGLLKMYMALQNHIIVILMFTLSVIGYLGVSGTHRSLDNCFRV